MTHAVSSSPLSLRVDVQNLPRAALLAGQSGHFSLRVPSGVRLDELKTTLHGRLVGALLQDNTHKSLDFDVEVYDLIADQFRPLTSRSQLGRRSRLNVILHTHDNDNSVPALPARLFAVDTSAGAFRIHGHAVLIDEVENSGLGTGLTTWDGSIVLAKYLEHTFVPSGGFQNMRILEVGAGTGLVGLSAALIGGGQDVILTDLEYTMANLERNIQRTMAQVPESSTRVHAHVLDWLNPVSDFGDIDLILASDVVWVEELIAPLVQTMHHLVTASSVPTKILMSHQQRSVVSDSVLFHELERNGFRRREVKTNELHPYFISGKIQVWEIDLALR